MATTRKIAGYWTAAQKNAVAVRGKGTQVFVLPIPAAVAGDQVQMKSSQCFTSNEDYPAGSPAFVWVDIFLSINPDALVLPVATQQLAARSGTNIAPAQHHYTFERCGDAAVPIGGDGQWNVVYVVNWDGDPVIKRDGTINQSATYGEMSINVLPKGQWTPFAPRVYAAVRAPARSR